MIVGYRNQQLFPYPCNSYIRKNLGNVIEDDTSEIDNLKKELEESKTKIAELKTKLLKYEPDEVKID